MHRAILSLANQWHVKCDNIATLNQLIDRSKITALGTCARRVATQHTEAPSTTILLDQTPDIAHADNAQTVVGRTTAIALANALQRRRNPLQHASRIAPCGRCNLDVVRAAIVEVDVIVTNCGCGDHTHSRAIEQRRITLCSGANNERVAIAHSLSVEPLARKILHLGIRLEYPRDERDSIIDRDFHIYKGNQNFGRRPFCEHKKSSSILADHIFSLHLY